MVECDSLIGLLNWLVFFEILVCEFVSVVVEGCVVGVVVFDVDEFKFVNDCYGYVIGDEFLSVISV